MLGYQYILGKCRDAFRIMMQANLKKLNDNEVSLYFLLVCIPLFFQLSRGTSYPANLAGYLAGFSLVWANMTAFSVSRSGRRHGNHIWGLPGHLLPCPAL